MTTRITILIALAILVAAGLALSLANAAPTATPRYEYATLETVDASSILGEQLTWETPQRRLFGISNSKSSATEQLWELVNPGAKDHYTLARLLNRLAADGWEPVVSQQSAGRAVVIFRRPK